MGIQRAAAVEALESALLSRAGVSVVDRLFAPVFRMMKETTQSLQVNFANDSEPRSLEVRVGASLREVLLTNGLTPYRGIFQSMNCGGLGVCGSCKVLVRENGEWWERRSCQIRCFQPLEIKIQ